MTFEDKIIIQRRVPPIKAYIHSAGYPKMGNEVKMATDHLLDIADHSQEEINRFDYLIAIMWRQSPTTRMIDFFGYKGINPWPGNPDVSAWVTRNSEPHEVTKFHRNITCGDSLILLGKEEELRRKYTNLESYLLAPVSLLELPQKLRPNEYVWTLEDGLRFMNGPD